MSQVDALQCCLRSACVVNSYLDKCLLLFIAPILFHLLSALKEPFECLHESKNPLHSKLTPHKANTRYVGCAHALSGLHPNIFLSGS